MLITIGHNGQHVMFKNAVAIPPNSIGYEADYSPQE